MSAFTLIEVLVVVAIIAVLLAILLPSLAAARRQAKATVCGAQLSQISLGNVMYTQAYKDVLPHLGYRIDRERVLWLWFTQIAPYTRNAFRLLVCPSDQDPDQHSVVLKNGKIRMADPVEPATVMPVTYRGSCDALDDGNIWYLRSINNPALVPVGTMPRKVTAYQRPAFNILQLEGWPVSQSGQACLRFDQMTHLLDKKLFPTPLEKRALESFKRHDGRTNFVFADGHVGRHTIDEACSKLPHQQEFRFVESNPFH